VGGVGQGGGGVVGVGGGGVWGVVWGGHDVLGVGWPLRSLRARDGQRDDIDDGHRRRVPAHRLSASRRCRSICAGANSPRRAGRAIRFDWINSPTRRSFICRNRADLVADELVRLDTDARARRALCAHAQRSARSRSPWVIRNSAFPAEGPPITSAETSTRMSCVANGLGLGDHGAARR